MTLPVFGAAKFQDNWRVQGRVCPSASCGNLEVSEDSSKIVSPDWSDLPSSLLESIFKTLVPPEDLKTQYGIIGTCSSWRALGMPLFFDKPWTLLRESLIKRPSQLFELAPPQCIKLQCFIVRRRPASPFSGEAESYEMWQGASQTAPSPRFLLTAHPLGRFGFSISLNRPEASAGQSAPRHSCGGGTSETECARLLNNLPRTHYRLLPCDKPWVSNVLKGVLRRQPSSRGGSVWGSEASSSSQLLSKVPLMTAHFCVSIGRILAFAPRRLTIQVAQPNSSSAAPSSLEHVGGQTPTQATASHPSPSSALASHSSGGDLADLQPMASPEDGPDAGAICPPHMVKLQNRLPQWNREMGCWCLNFNDRVKVPSVKNFQLAINRGDGSSSEGATVTSARNSRAAAMASSLLFGKVSKDAYVLDFDPTMMSSLQAFALALTAFERKYTL